MKIKIPLIVPIILVLTLWSCSNDTFNLTKENVKVVNRDISFIDKTTNTVTLNDKEGAGMAIIEEVSFDVGTIELELKGENNPGKSFIGLAYNIENDSTYEAIYFRPFNFQSKEKIRRARSVQYISEPKHTWFFLRNNFEGKYESEYVRQPSPDDWFGIKIKINNDEVEVYDTESNSVLLSVKRLNTKKSDKIGLWVGNNSKGEFRNLKISK